MVVHYSQAEGGAFAVHCFEPGVVALDLDEPEDCPGNFLAGVKHLATQMSREYCLGLYWLYQTLHGYHVIYQCRLASEDAAMKVVAKATTIQPVHECWGHAQWIADYGPTLRVGCKPYRPSAASIKNQLDGPPLTIRIDGSSSFAGTHISPMLFSRWCFVKPE